MPRGTKEELRGDIDIVGGEEAKLRKEVDDCGREEDGGVKEAENTDEEDVSEELKLGDMMNIEA